MAATVHLEACDTYERGPVREAVRRALQAVAPDLITSGARVLLKPNVINSMPPERAVCTHPEVLRAVAEWVLEQGGEVTVGDQPGYALAEDVETCFRDSGLIAACADLPVTFRLLARGGYDVLTLKQYHRLREVQYAREVLQADLVINLPKAKTHSQTLYTGAVKNMFGAVAPKQRLDIHLLGRYWALSEAIADCYAARVPDLHLMDAVVGMEGLGPTQGTAVEIGFLAASRDGVALDAVTEHLLGFEAGKVATTVAAGGLGLGERALDKIPVTGASLDSVRRPIKQSPVVRADLMGPLVRILGWLVEAKPQVNRKLCRGCRACAGICPASTINMDKVAVIDHRGCVECFCCLEACPYDAITVRRSPLYQLAWWIKRQLDHRALGRKEHGH